MTDISVFKKMLAPEPGRFTPTSPRLKKVWLCAYKSKILPGRFQYHLWTGKYSPLYEFSTFNLKHARGAAYGLGEIIIEQGPPEAFGRAPE